MEPQDVTDAKTGAASSRYTEVEGYIECPNTEECKVLLGVYCLYGTDCNCGKYIHWPAYQINKEHVYETIDPERSGEKAEVKKD